MSIRRCLSKSSLRLNAKSEIAHAASLLRIYPWPPSTETGFTPAYRRWFNASSVHFPKCHSRASPHLNPDGLELALTISAFLGSVKSTLGSRYAGYILFSLPIQSMFLSTTCVLTNLRKISGITNTSVSTLYT